MQGEISLNIGEGGNCSAMAIGAGSAQSVAFAAPAGSHGQFVLVAPTVACYARQGVNPVAVATGADQVLFGGQLYRVWVSAGNKLALIAVGTTGTCYFGPQG